MRVFDVGQSVFLLRFLPDGRQLVVGSAARSKVSFAVWPLDSDQPVRPALPPLDLNTWRSDGGSGNAPAVHPTGKMCYLAWSGGLFAFRTADGKVRAVLERVLADRVVLSPDGRRLLAASPNRGGGRFTAVTIAEGWRTVVWRKRLAPPAHIAGFLPDGVRFVTLDGAVRIRSFDTGDQLTFGRLGPAGFRQPQITP